MAGGDSHDGERPGAAPAERLVLTSGAVLRRSRPDDAESFARAVAESLHHLQPWMPWATPANATPTAQRERLTSAEAAWNGGSSYAFALVTSGDSVIGSFGLTRHAGASTVEIGYWVHVGHTRRGHATAGAAALTDAALALAGVLRVEIHCDEANAFSAAVPARLGYRLDRVEPSPARAPAETGRIMIWVVDAAAG